MTIHYTCNSLKLHNHNMDWHYFLPPWTKLSTIFPVRDFCVTLAWGQATHTAVDNGVTSRKQVHVWRHDSRCQTDSYPSITSLFCEISVLTFGGRFSLTRTRSETENVIPRVEISLSLPHTDNRFYYSHPPFCPDRISLSAPYGKTRYIHCYKQWHIQSFKQLNWSSVNNYTVHVVWHHHYCRSWKVIHWIWLKNNTINTRIWWNISH